MRTLRVAAVQAAAHDRARFRGIWPEVLERLKGAAATGSLVVLPEGTIPAYVLGPEPLDERDVAAAIEDCRQVAAASGAAIVVGCARFEGSRVYNGALVIDTDGRIAGWAEKHFLWHFDRRWFAPGERIAPIDTAVGRLGVLVCADGRIPTIARTLVDRGAEVLVMPTAWVTSGRDPDHLENVQADLLARVRAKENGVPFVAANKCGVERGCVAYCGKSQIVRADGTIAALASERHEEEIDARIDLEPPRPFRASAPLAGSPDFGTGAPLRIALVSRAPLPDDAALLDLLDADALLYGDRILDRNGTRNLPVLNDDAVFDPGALAGERVRGRLTLAAWSTSTEPHWQLAFARARALELRIFLCVFDNARKRAYAVDPDGTILCGTFEGYEVAGFAFDPARTAQTFVAPGTDVLEGLRRAADASI